MRPNIIEAPVLIAAVDRVLENLPEVLEIWRPCLRAPLLRHVFVVEELAPVATCQDSDPEWVQRAFDRKDRLYRLGDDHIVCIIHELSGVMGLLAEVAVVGGDERHPMRHEARRFFRSLLHWQPRPERPRYYICRRLVASELEQMTNNFLVRSQRAWCRKHRHDRFVGPRSIRAGALTGILCTTIAEIVALGREARNCLAEIQETHMNAIRRREDIWALRAADGSLVCVLRTRLEPEPLGIELRGPQNHLGVAGHGHDLIQWFITAGIKVGHGCEIRLADLMPPEMRGPTAEEEAKQLFGMLLAA